MQQALIWIIAITILGASAWFFLRPTTGRRAPKALRPGRKLPDFEGFRENGDSVRSGDLAGAPAVILFVRGNWCPFCNSQVADLTSHYKDIVDLGARLIFITPKPLETTRRVAEFYAVEFEFWLDEDLAIATNMGLLHTDAVPDDYRKEYGNATVLPAALVVDADGIIRFSEVSKTIVDRPDSKKLLGELRKLVEK